MEFQWMSDFPCEKHGWYWELELIPHISFVRNPTEGIAFGIGWLFWTAAVFIDIEQ